MKTNHIPTGQNPKRGQAMTEFALIVPVFILLVLAIFEFGRAFYIYSAIANAAREGARVGIVRPSDTNAIKNRAIENAVFVGLTTGDITVQCISSCSYDQKIQVTVNYTFTSVAPLIPSFNMSRSATMRIESP